MKEYYRSAKGFEGKRYQVRVSDAELKGLMTTMVLVSIAAAVILSLASFALGLSLR